MGGWGSKKDQPQQEAANFEKTDDIYRRAIERYAEVEVGFFYDARQDRFAKEKTKLPISGECRTIEKLLRCEMITKNECGNQTLLDFIDIDRDLCLSVKLNMVSESPLSLLIKHTRKINAFTRILYYYYISEERCIPGKQIIPKIPEDVSATHFVTEIKFGIFLLVVLELTPQDESHLHGALRKIIDQLAKERLNLIPHDKRLLDRFISTKVFSNLPELCKLTKLDVILEKLVELKQKKTDHRPLEYALRPIKSLIPSISKWNYDFTPLTSETIDKIEQHFICLSPIVKSLERSFTSEEEISIENHFHDQFNEVQLLISNVKREHESKARQICQLVYKMRGGASQEESIAQMKLDEYAKLLRTQITGINDALYGLQGKFDLIGSWKGHRIKYWNVKKIVGNDDDDLERIIKQLVKAENRIRIFCFDDKLEKLRSSQWDKFYQYFIKECQNNPELEFVYADFSFCSCRLTTLKELAPGDQSEQQKDASKRQPTKTTTPPPKASESKPKASSPKPTSPRPTNPQSFKFINVVLLGESGVGKSTFINAIVNYLQFDNLEAAHSGQPIVLTPVSFLITEGNDFKERIVQFGDKDSNENHNQSGQSVTQQCRSYVFTVGTQTRLRLIDTPGMGDTRGIDQDDLNMQHILSFISNLPYLNAVCILLKPNESKLNVVLRSYFTRLVCFLGEHVRSNIIFCFTNTRATFFVPGDTGPLLKKMLQSQSSTRDIPFEKRNTFCFDSESFRYLVAEMSGVDFDNYQKGEYRQSWITSVKESNRLLEYICTKLAPYPQNSWQSIEHAQFLIKQLIRPVLETLRNTRRNIILLEKTSSRYLIKLNSTSVSGDSRICLDCRHLQFLEYFWIVFDKSFVSMRCDKCSSDSSRHLRVDYLITYKIDDVENKQLLKTLKINLDQLKETITNFNSFFKYVARISMENDPILSTLGTMINEEKHICSKKGSNILNVSLCQSLEDLRNRCEKLWTNSATNQNSVSLSEIYNQIRKVCENPTISEQLNAIKQTREFYMTEHEKRIS